MQSFTDFPDSTKISESLVLLLNNDKTVMSANAGTTFPTTNLVQGMFCFRSNLPTAAGGLYELVVVEPADWKLIRDFAKSPLHKEEADALYAATGHNHDGVYSPLGHNHNGVYSPLGHNHDGVYSPLGHNHDSTYEPANAQLAKLNVTQGWTKPQRPKATDTRTVGGTVTLDFTQFQNFVLTLSSALTLGAPTIDADCVGQKGTIRIIPGTYTTPGGWWSGLKRVSSDGATTMASLTSLPSSGVVRLDYEVISTSRIAIAYSVEEA